MGGRAIETAETMQPLAKLAQSAGLSPYHFHRVLKAITGVTPRDLDAAHRAHRMRESLVKTEQVTDAIGLSVGEPIL